MLSIDRCIAEFDKGLAHRLRRASLGAPVPAGSARGRSKRKAERRHAAGLMRVNHCGEVCAQALYRGRRLLRATSRCATRSTRRRREEADHLAWCERPDRGVGCR